MDIAGLRLHIKERFENAGVPDAGTDTDLILMSAFGYNKGELFLHGSDPVEEELLGLINGWCARREKREPLQHILGYAWFMGYRFKVNGNVLVPRQDTEVLVEEAAKYLEDGVNILDIFTGSGCIAISLALMSEGGAKVTAGDVSDAALKVAAENALNLGAAIHFIQCDIFAPIPKEPVFDIITANPPYIRYTEIENLQPEVRDFDPYIALSGGRDGLDFYRKVAKDLDFYLAEEGRIFMEIGHDQGQSVTEIFENEGFVCEPVIKDLSGLDRVVVARRPY